MPNQRDPDKRAICVWMDKHEAEEVKAAAAARGVTVSELIRHLIKKRDCVPPIMVHTD